jgi:hypothetical protein
VGVNLSDAVIVGSNPALCMEVCFRIFVMLSCVGRGLCDGLISHPKES